MPFPHRRPITRLVSLLTLVSVLACTTWRVDTRPLPEVVAERGFDRIRVTLHDSTSTVLREPALQADSLTGRASWGVITIPIASIAYVATRRVDAGGTSGVVVGTLLATAVVAAVVAAVGVSNTWGR